MKIFAINNYSLEQCERKAQNRAMPYHHCWGIDCLKEKGHKVECECYKGNETRGGKGVIE